LIASEFAIYINRKVKSKQVYDTIVAKAIDTPNFKNMHEGLCDESEVRVYPRVTNIIDFDYLDKSPTYFTWEEMDEIKKMADRDKIGFYVDHGKADINLDHMIESFLPILYGLSYQNNYEG
jgi:hypothetical protein